MNWLSSWLLLSISVWIASILVPGFSVNGVWGTLKVAALFGIANVLLGSALYATLGVLTLGIGFVSVLSFLTRLVANALLLKLVDALSSSVKIDGFRSALWGALVISITGTALGHFWH